MNGTEIRKGNRGRGERLWSWLFLLPTILFLGFTALLPLLYSLYLSLFQYKINLPNAVPKFIGIGNYLRMLQDKNLGVSVGNTVLFAVVSVSLEFGFRAFSGHDALRHQKNLPHFYFFALDSYDYGSCSHWYTVSYDVGRQYGNHQLPLTFCGCTPNELAE